MSNCRIKKITILIAIIIVGVTALSLCAATVYADESAGEDDTAEITDDYIIRRSLMRGLNYCYDKALRKEFTLSDAKIKTGRGINYIFEGNAKFYVPTGFFTDSGGKDYYNEINCAYQEGGIEHAYSGLMSYLAQSVFPKVGQINYSSDEDLINYYTGMGFEGTTQGTSNNSIDKEYKLVFTNPALGVESNALIIQYNSEDKIIGMKATGTAGSAEVKNTKYTFYLYGCVNSAAVVVDSSVQYQPVCDSGNALIQVQIYWDGANQKRATLNIPPVSDQGFDIGYFSENLEEIIENSRSFDGWEGDSISSDAVKTGNQLSLTEITSSDNQSGINAFKATSATTVSAARTYLGATDNDAFSTADFDDTELYYIYMSYLRDIYGVNIIYSTCSASSSSDSSIPVVVKDAEGTKSWTYCPIDSHNDKNVTIRTGANLDNSTKKYADLLGLIKDAQLKASLSRLPANQLEQDSTTPVGGLAGTGEDANTAQGKCLALNAAGSLGWILCPILEVASSAVNWLYTEVVSPFLEIDSSLLSQSNGTYVAWQIFQNFANIVAVIFLLVIIFSQVTGVGIDNYGIKKALPKIIIAFILINLSYIVCQLAVDLSNVAGKGINDLFNNIASEVTITSIDNEAIPNGGAISATAGTIGVISVLVGAVVLFPGVSAAVAGVAAMAAPGILLAVISTIISMLVAILMLFALLTLRKVAVVILVAISPLAFVCYMLPNTKSLFNKWVKFLENMLLLFPICGLVIGGGNLVSRIILTSSGNDGNVGFAMALAAMLAGIIPFFFVPTLLKGAMNVFGNIGAKLGGLSKTAGARAKGFAGDTDRFKDFQQQQKLKADQTRAKRLQAQIAARQAKGKPVSARLQRNAGVVNQRIAQAQAANSKNEIWGSQSRMKSAQASLEKQEAEAAVQDHMTTISLAANFDKEDGGKMYNESQKARAAAAAARAAGDYNSARNLDSRADAYIELAGQNKAAASTFMKAMRDDTSAGALSTESARRIMDSQNTDKFRKDIAYQYVRNRYSKPTTTTDNAHNWSNNGANLDEAISANITSAADYAGLNTSSLQHLYNNKTSLSAKSQAALEEAAAEADEQQLDTSKQQEFRNMRGRTLTAAQKETAKQVAATTAQTAAINTATANLRTDMASAQAAQTAQAQVQFRQQHITNVETRRQRLGPYATIIPEGYALNRAETLKVGHNVYSDPSGTSHYDSHKNEFY